MPLDLRRRLLAGLGVIAAAMIMLETAAHRLWVAVLGAERAHLVACLWAFSAAGGALVSAVTPGPAHGRPAPTRLARLGGVAAAASMVWVIFFAYLSTGKAGLVLDAGPAELRLDATGKALMAAIVVVGVLPAFLGGVLASLGARLFRDTPRSFVAALVLGAATGALPAVLAVRLGAPRAILIGAATAAVGALLLRVPSTRDHDVRHSVTTGGLATVLLGALVLLGGDYGDPWLEYVVRVRGVADKSERKVWSELGLVTIDKASGGRSWLREDGADVPPMLDGVATPTAEPEDLAYVLSRGEGSALLLDAGGGRDIRAALKAGQKRIVATVLNPAIASLLRGDYRKKSGDVEGTEGVTLLVSDGRALPGFASGPYRSVVLPSSAGAASAAFDAARGGGLAATRAGLLTREAWVGFLDLLEPQGALVSGGPPAELDARIALGIEALRAVGSATPRKHLFACSSKDDAALLVKRSELSTAELRVLRKQCKTNKLNEVLAPDVPPTPVAKALFEGEDLRAAALSAGADVGVASDARPFSRRAEVGLRGVTRRLIARTGGEAERAVALGGVGGLLVALVALGVGLVAWVSAPVRGPRRNKRLVPAALALGAGLWAAQAAVVRGMIVVLGHPTYALLFAVPVVGFAAAVGALASPSYAGAGSARALASRGLAASVLAVVLLVAFQEASPWLVSLSFGARLGVALGAGVGLGLVGGALVPFALGAARDVGVAEVPVAFAVVAAGWAVGATTGPLLVHANGFGVLFVAAALLLFAASLLAPAGKGSALSDAS